MPHNLTNGKTTFLHTHRGGNFNRITPPSLSEAFNIDTEHPLRFNGTAEDFFGYSVYQSEFENRKHCSPYLPHECDGNSYLNGVCVQFNSGLQAVSNFTAAYQECTKREVNLVFLFDGSKSLKPEEFEMNKKFILDVMKKLSKSSIKFAAVQFASTFRTVFDFNEYKDGSAEDKLMKEPHMYSLTNTHGAIDYVLKNLLNSVSSGADLSAQKALVIITDGEPTDFDDENALNRCDEQNILRYVIGFWLQNDVKFILPDRSLKTIH
ncbi:unnamed protein product [Leuciscus chuanchicus]